MQNHRDSTFHCAFVAALESWGAGGQPIDVLTLKDGRVLAIMETRIVVYDDERAFEAGMPRGLIEL